MHCKPVLLCYWLLSSCFLVLIINISSMWYEHVSHLFRRCFVFWKVELTLTDQTSLEQRLFTLLAGNVISHNNNNSSDTECARSSFTLHLESSGLALRLNPAVLKLILHYSLATARETQPRSFSLEVPSTSLTTMESLHWMSVCRWVFHFWVFFFSSYFVVVWFVLLCFEFFLPPSGRIWRNLWDSHPAP